MVMFSFYFSLPHPTTKPFGRGFSRSQCMRPSFVRIVSFRPLLIFKKKTRLGLGLDFDGLSLNLSMLRWTTYPLSCSAFDSQCQSVKPSVRWISLVM